MEFEVFLQNVGVDKEETLNRFAGMAKILEKFLLKFPEDPVYGSLLESIKKGSLEETELNMHTFKGVTGNLGLGKLHKLSAESLERMRKNQCMLSQTELEEIQQEYYRVIAVIREYRGE